MRKISILLLLSLLFSAASTAGSYSVAGLFPLQESGRQVFNFNSGWLFLRADIAGAEQQRFDDSQWENISLPHSVQLMPAEASGCRNYQGIAWYRKRFILPESTKANFSSIYFEAAMGRKEVYINGHKVFEHEGGYLPFSIDLTGAGVQAGDTCLIALRIDNSNDKNYPPGKPQYTLDFAYHGGIYRDAYLIARNPIALTDPIEAKKPASGGVFIHCDEVSTERAVMVVDTDIANRTNKQHRGTVDLELIDPNGTTVARTSKQISIKAGTEQQLRQSFTIKNPTLWHPDSPALYRVAIRLRKGKEALDGGTVRIGIRRAEFKGKEGFFLNGKPFGDQLIGTNRHQDFAYVGNAMPNSQQWRDAFRLRNAGCRIIRSAHYPQDPAFMDACDELGLFVIVATPGWQYWNKDPRFAELVHRNTREMIRRDRNHPSVILWEPILNETRFPLEFSSKALQITREEYPYPGAPGAAADLHSDGVEGNYAVVYGWPKDQEKSKSTLFTREFGENVDDWYAHNNNNRASRSWGERPLRVQALSLARSYDEMYRTDGQFIGGAQWHAFDHQRGYHPDPYWGGIMDAFRQPKYAYYMFQSQMAASRMPVLYIMNEMTAFTEPEVIIFSNCDSVRLSIYGEKSWTKPVVRGTDGMPHAPVVFDNVFDFWEARNYSYFQKNWQKVEIIAEGIIAGKVVCRQTKMPARRSTKLRLSIDSLGKQLVADGSDFIVVIAEVTDDNGNIRRLAKEEIQFSIEGEGSIIGDERIKANPRTVEFGSAPLLVRATRTPGKITVRARVLFEGTHAPTPAEISLESIAPTVPFVNGILPNKASDKRIQSTQTHRQDLSEEEKRKLLNEVERQQSEFGVQQ